MVEEPSKPENEAEPTQARPGAGAQPPAPPTRPPTLGQVPPRMTIKGPDKKTETTRIDLASAQPPPVKPETQRLKPDTQRVAPPVEPSQQPTMRVDIEQRKKRETTRLEVPLGEAPKRQTAKIDTAQIRAAEREDIFKRSTIPVGIPTAPPPAPKPPTGQMPRPKTLQVKRPSAPAESIITPNAPAVEAAMEAKKSETARIDLPADVGERPATRPKTIRIKRPDGTTAKKALTIARPAAEDTAVADVAATTAVESTEDAGMLVFVASAIALLVLAVLVYVLAAQTFAPSLPFPGRI